MACHPMKMFLTKAHFGKTIFREVAETGAPGPEPHSPSQSVSQFIAGLIKNDPMQMLLTTAHSPSVVQ